MGGTGRNCVWKSYFKGDDTGMDYDRKKSTYKKIVDDTGRDYDRKNHHRGRLWMAQEQIMIGKISIEGGNG